MRALSLISVVGLMLSTSLARADILYCSSGDGQVILRTGNTTFFTSEPTVRSILFSMLFQLPGNERIDLVYKDGKKDSFVLNGDSASEFHNLARQPGDGRDSNCR